MRYVSGAFALESGQAACDMLDCRIRCARQNEEDWNAKLTMTARPIRPTSALDEKVVSTPATTSRDPYHCIERTRETRRRWYEEIRWETCPRPNGSSCSSCPADWTFMHSQFGRHVCYVFALCFWLSLLELMGIRMEKGE